MMAVAPPALGPAVALEGAGGIRSTGFSAGLEAATAAEPEAAVTAPGTGVDCGGSVAGRDCEGALGGTGGMVGGRVKPVDITTLPYSGFPTDAQAQMMVLMALTPGISIITERIFEARFMHVSELARLGADIEIEGPSAIVKGGRPLSGAPVMASDLRASAALVIAGLAAKGRTQVNRVYHIDRGYEHLDEKLQELGAHIERVKSE